MRSDAVLDVDERLADNLERVKALVDSSDRSKGGRPAFDHVLMFKGLIVQGMHRVGLTLDREAPGAALSMDCSRRFDETFRASGFLAMSSQIVDAPILAPPKQRDAIEEKTDRRLGKGRTGQT